MYALSTAVATLLPRRLD